VQPPEPDAFAKRGLRAMYLFVLPDGGQLRELRRLTEAGELQVNVSRSLALEQAAHAHELLEQGHVQGKLVLSVP